MNLKNLKFLENYNHGTHRQLVSSCLDHFGDVAVLAHNCGVPQLSPAHAYKFLPLTRLRYPCEQGVGDLQGEIQTYLLFSHCLASLDLEWAERGMSTRYTSIPGL